MQKLQKQIKNRKANKETIVAKQYYTSKRNNGRNKLQMQIK